MASRSDVPTILHNAFAAVLGVLFFLVCICGLGHTSWMWWKTRSWQPVQAQIVISQRVEYSRQLGRDDYIRNASYDYSVDGAKYTGSDISLGSGLSGWGNHRVVRRLQEGQVVTVWLNPRQPDQSVLLRTFRWYAAACWFFGSLLTFKYVWEYFRPNQRRRGEYLITFYWNLIALQFAVIAVWDGKFWPLLTVFLMVLVGILVAGRIVRPRIRQPFR